MKLLFCKLTQFFLVATLMIGCVHKEEESSKQAQELLQQALKVAHESREQGSHPFGAVLVYKNRIFLRGHNHVTQANNPMKHAEIVLLEKYVEYKNADYERRLIMAPDFVGELPEIKDCQMFASTQPCQMCEGALML